MQTKSFLLKTFTVVIAIVLLCTTGCTGDRAKFDEVQPAIVNNFTTDLNKIAAPNANIYAVYSKLKKEYGRFFQVWTNEIMDLGKYGSGDSAQAELLQRFAGNNRKVFLAMLKHYEKYPEINNQINDALGHTQQLIGDKSPYRIVSYFSQFSDYRTFIDTMGKTTVVAYSAEMFLDDTFPLYKMLEVPDFYNRYNATEQLPAMLVWNYLKAKYESEFPSKNMLDEAVFNGKIWYTMERVFGEKELWKNLGYTEMEWKKMVEEEGQIWRHYVNENMLFNSNFNAYKRYFIYGNHTFGSGIPPDCPPLIGNFTGYRIVKAFMKEKNMSLKELWAFKDAADLYRKSTYNPIR
ncbi:MAG: hypothetical protein KG003_09675 [Bacteroidetes bacterium]|nr:hypothetical protein [Bacteroidota bacterium]